MKQQRACAKCGSRAIVPGEECCLYCAAWNVPEIVGQDEFFPAIANHRARILAEPEDSSRVFGIGRVIANVVGLRVGVGSRPGLEENFREFEIVLTIGTDTPGRLLVSRPYDRTQMIAAIELGFDVEGEALSNVEKGCVREVKLADYAGLDPADERYRKAFESWAGPVVLSFVRQWLPISKSLIDFVACIASEIQADGVDTFHGVRMKWKQCRGDRFKVLSDLDVQQLLDFLTGEEDLIALFSGFKG